MKLTSQIRSSVCLMPTVRPANTWLRSIEPFQTRRIVTREHLAAGLAENAELPAHLAHALALEKTGDNGRTLLRHRTLLPRHRHLPPNGEKCYPCGRYVLSPFSQAGERCGNRVAGDAVGNVRLA